MALIHARALLRNPHTRIVEGDVRRPEEILQHPDVRALIDFREPVALLMFAILHHLHDEEDPAGVTARFLDGLPAGSFVAISHFCNPGEDNLRVSEHVTAFEKVFNAQMGTGRWRTREEILTFFHGHELLEPGLGPMPNWHPDHGNPEPCSEITHHGFIGGVAHLR